MIISKITCTQVGHKFKKWSSACGRIGDKWHNEIIPNLGIILTDILPFYKLASSANLYRFTHFRKITFGCFFANCLLGQHPQSPLKSSCDDGCSFILNDFINSTSTQIGQKLNYKTDFDAIYIEGKNQKIFVAQFDILVFLLCIQYNEPRKTE